MTCREKLAIEHPEYIDKDAYAGGCYRCPHHYGYLQKPDYCSGGDIEVFCRCCWNREMPDEIPVGIERCRMRYPLGEPEKEPTKGVTHMADYFHDKLVQSIKDVGQDIINNAEDYAGQSPYLSRLTITIDFNPEYAGVGGMLNPEIDVDKTYLCGTIVERMRGECDL